MINIKHLLKVTSAWISAVYVICYTGVAIFPSSRVLFMRYSLHADVSFVSSYFSLGYFITGLIIWNVMAIAGAWLFAYLYNKIK